MDLFTLIEWALGMYILGNIVSYAIAGIILIVLVIMCIKEKYGR